MTELAWGRYGSLVFVGRHTPPSTRSGGGAQVNSWRASVQLLAVPAQRLNTLRSGLLAYAAPHDMPARGAPRQKSGLARRVTSVRPRSSAGMAHARDVKRYCAPISLPR